MSVLKKFTNKIVSMNDKKKNKICKLKIQKKLINICNFCKKNIGLTIPSGYDEKLLILRVEIFGTPCNVYILHLQLYGLCTITYFTFIQHRKTVQQK